MTEHIFKYTDLLPLENAPLNGNFKILIVGTFNGNIKGNTATWFYGRPENEFWCLFPRMLGHQTMHPVDRDENFVELTTLWKKFCAENKIVIVDLFKDVLVQLESHADKELEKLAPNQVVEFDFMKAFENTSFDKVMFTWKGMNNNLLTEMKIKYSNFFETRASSIHHLLTPSNAYSKPRNFKLNQWIQSYKNE